MGEQTQGDEGVLSKISCLLFFAGFLASLGVLFSTLALDYHHAPTIAASGADTTLLVEGCKELDSAVALLTTLTTGLFVLVAVASRTSLRPNSRPLFGQTIVLIIFATSAGGSFYEALQSKYLVSEGLLARALDLPLIETEIGLQAWFVAFASASALALFANALMLVRP